MATPTIDNATVRVLAKDWTSASSGMTREDAEYGGLTVSRSSSLAVWLEWKVPLSKGGKWYLHANLAAGSNRPAVLTINGVRQTQAVCGDTTTGWHARDTKWFVYGPFEFKSGENTIRCDFSQMMPSLREFGFSPEEVVAPAPTTGPTKLGPVGSLENANAWEVVPKAGGAQPRITAVTTGHNWSLGSVAAQWEYAGEAPAALQKPQVTNTTGFFEIPAGDHLVAIHVGHGQQHATAPANEVITLQYETLKGVKSPVYGGQGSPVVKNHTLRAPEGQQIIGFFGANGGAQNVPLRIGIYVDALPASEVEPKGISSEEWDKAREAFEKRIAALEEELKKCAACGDKIAALNDALAALTNKFNERDQKCALKEQAVADLQKQIADLAKTNEAVQKALADQERSNIDQERRLLEQDKKLAEQERSNIEQERKLLAQDKKLADQEKHNLDQERKLLEQDKKIADQEKSNVEQERKLLEQDKKLATFDALLTALGVRMGDVLNVVDAQKQQIVALEAQAAKCGDCEAKLAAQAQTIADLEQKVADLAAKLADAAKPVEPPPAPVVPVEPPKPAKPEKLDIIEGIGPKITELLAQAGITSFKKLAAANSADLKKILSGGGKSFSTADPSTWPKQAQLVVDGKLDELKALQATLRGGK